MFTFYSQQFTIIINFMSLESLFLNTLMYVHMRMRVRARVWIYVCMYVYIKKISFFRIYESEKQFDTPSITLRLIKESHLIAIN